MAVGACLLCLGCECAGSMVWETAAAYIRSAVQCAAFCMSHWNCTGVAQRCCMGFALELHCTGVALQLHWSCTTLFAHWVGWSLLEFHQVPNIRWSLTDAPVASPPRCRLRHLLACDRPDPVQLPPAAALCFPRRYCQIASSMRGTRGSCMGAGICKVSRLTFPSPSLPTPYLPIFLSSMHRNPSNPSQFNPVQHAGLNYFTATAIRQPHPS
eukprot:365042-Chlamydomonas_euryale.AAC.8